MNEPLGYVIAASRLKSIKDGEFRAFMSMCDKTSATGLAWPWIW